MLELPLTVVPVKITAEDVHDNAWDNTSITEDGGFYSKAIGAHVEKYQFHNHKDQTESVGRSERVEQLLELF